ncbi:MAG: hypothetical protein Q7U28_08070 [Aquabacterium sp.]|nr:hypothetical protein [Aquabacterium sp.]
MTEKRILLSPHEIIAPGCGSPDLLTQSKPRPAASPADLATPPLRPTSEDALEHPSRIGNKLHWRDGRVTDFQPPKD